MDEMEIKALEQKLSEIFMAVAECNVKIGELEEKTEALQKRTDALDTIAGVVRGLATVAELSEKMAVLQETVQASVKFVQADVAAIDASVKRLEGLQVKYAHTDQVEKKFASLQEESRITAEQKTAEFNKKIDQLKAQCEERHAGAEISLAALKTELSKLSADVSGIARAQKADAKDISSALKTLEAFIHSAEARFAEAESGFNAVGTAVAELAMLTVPKPDDDPAEVYTEEHRVFVRMNEDGNVIEIANEETVEATAVFVGGNPWVEIDHGRGAKFDDPEANGYLEDGLLDNAGIPLYCVKDRRLCKRSGAAVRQDREKKKPAKRKGGKA